ncbi:YggS family pyridoxal phosphate-dependent enzyme [Aureisphaera galaxeae]|uniref:YggS family pyridoxal phosphate-dependent enzyme n=1 Tax=Aureisphaera galaxeae TaxID=1538023 RepID=UPI00235013E6|nr:YggS family pyridoxal phosphate-dependent enzyme [Aureisphaera galaxeae]MDC8004957.1 YggS family pyridoxal phosphate-dependent enzyme [Aureisphaera galaxeae]
MSTIFNNLEKVKTNLPKGVTLVAVSKTKPVSTLMEAYEAGQRVFGENKIQEMVGKWEEMPEDIEWHMIGHVQTNKVKYMASFVSLIHAVDSFKLLKEINKQAAKHDRIIKCLLQVKIAQEDSKFGMSAEDTEVLLSSDDLNDLQHIEIVGLMGMATFTDDQEQLAQEFGYLKTTFDRLQQKYTQLTVLSMGMSGDYPLAISHGSNMVRVGSAIFGARNYS